MWYRTEEEAEKACLDKEQQYSRKFIVIADETEKDCYWAIREELVKPTSYF